LERRNVRVLVPAGFSKPAAYALHAAGEFVRQYGGRITLVTVIEPDPFRRFVYDPETNALNAP
jgi:nucleotide-binding universal stress UspA family protein